MRYGVCTGVGNAMILHEAGFDYIELSVAGDLVPEESDEIWNEKRDKIERMPLPVEAFNSFIRSGKITGPEADLDRLRRYVTSALARAAEVGGEIIVFGSGGTREIPEGFSREKAVNQTLDFLNICADVSDHTGVVVAIEPLTKQECNFINLVSEGTSLVNQLSRKGVRVLADTYHMEQEQEPLNAIIDAGPLLAHVHTADTGRYAPGTGGYDHAALFRALALAHYDKRVSVECSFNNALDTQAVRSIMHLRAQYDISRKSI